MAEQKELPISELELVYLNGQEHGGAPVFKDVRLSRDSQTVCERTIETAKIFNKRIRAESECKRCADFVLEIRDKIKQLKWLENQERKAWVHILTQIKAAINGLQTQLEQVGEQLGHRIETWQAEQEAGRNKIREDLLREATELERKAKYDSDPKASRKAQVQAKEVRKEAEQFKILKPIPGTATVIVYEFEIENRSLAAKLPSEAVAMEPQDKWFTDRIKEAKTAGQPIPTFPGIRVIIKTQVRLPR
jgi:hypothetical protein